VTSYFTKCKQPSFFCFYFGVDNGGMDVQAKMEEIEIPIPSKSPEKKYTKENI
jgi:hypothetical protein